MVVARSFRHGVSLFCSGSACGACTAYVALEPSLPRRLQPWHICEFVWHPAGFALTIYAVPLVSSFRPPEAFRQAGCLPAGILSLDVSAGVVVEELPQGREDPLILGIAGGRVISATPLPDLWPALVNGSHSSLLIGALSITPLYAAVICGCDGVSRLAHYVDAGASVDISAGDGTTALMVAFLTGQLDAAAFLLSRGASVNSVDSLGQPLSKYASCAVGLNPSWAAAEGPPSTDFSVRTDARTDRVVASCLKTLQDQGGWSATTFRAPRTRSILTNPQIDRI